MRCTQTATTRVSRIPDPARAIGVLTAVAMAFLYIFFALVG